ncbi:MAG: hypothetical protein WA989_04535, partial [Henriciella sp.]|uniref:hypothetical protein n=1 Tax=Henriciella sp. TaxID=1968823 RepID=UPI003C748340
MSSRALLGALALAAATSVQPALAQIQSAGLDDVDSWGVSFLERGEAGFSERLWLGSDNSYLLRLLGDLDVSSMTDAEQALLSRAMRSPSAEPEDEDADALMEARLDLLVLLGHDEAAATLARQLDEAPDHIDPDAILSDARLANGGLDVVCRQMDPAGEGAFWAQLRAICTLEAEDYASAELSTEIAAQQEGVEPWFSEVAIAMIGEREDRPDARYGSGLDYALSQLAGLEVSADTVESASDEIAARLARDEDLAFELRLLAADKAARAGTLPAADHRAIYKALVSQPDHEPESAIEAAFMVFARKAEPKPVEIAPAPSGSGPRDLRSMNEDWIEPVQPDEVSDEALDADPVDEISLEEEQALALAEALRQAARTKDTFAAAARLFEAELGKLAVNEDTRAGALIFATASLASGNEKGAVRWLNGLDLDELSDSEAFDAALLRGYALLLAGRSPDDMLSDVADVLIETGIEPRQQEQAMRLISLWSGFDVP